MAIAQIGPEDVARYHDACFVLDKLARPTTYITSQFRVDMGRDEVQANLDARQLLLKHRMGLLNEIEGWYLSKFTQCNSIR